MTATNNIATDLFYKIRSRFSGLKLGAETGQITVNPDEARFFDFDYKDGDAILGHVSISLAEENSIKVYFSSGITLEMDTLQKNKWYSFLKELRLFAKRRLMAFDTRDIAKDNLDKRDYEFLVKTSKQKSPAPKKQNPIGESIMNKNSSLYGSKTTSYQKLMDTKLIIKHRTALTDDQQRGARSRNISAIFVENADGERFKYPYIHLAGARAMQRHVANHGVPYDDIGKSIVKMSEEISQLRNFSRYVTRNHLLNDDTNNIIEHSSVALKKLREQVSRLHKQKNYEQYTESFYTRPHVEIPQDIIQEYTDKFTIKNFKEDIKSVFPILYRLMNETDISSVEYSDIVNGSILGTDTSYSLAETTSDIDAFESWINNLGENTGLTSKNQDEQQIAVGELQFLIDQPFPAGVNGENAIQSLNSLITDPELIQEIKEMSIEDADADIRPLLQKWLEFSMPEVLEQLDFSDLENLETEEEIDNDVEDTGEEQPEENIDDNVADEEQQAEGFMSNIFNKVTGRNSPESKITDFENRRNKARRDAAKLDKQYKWDDANIDTTDKQYDRGMPANGGEIIEFIKSFYDENTGTFPKGPEGVVTMVTKKFGAGSEKVARRMVNNLAPVQKILGNKMRESKNNKGRRLSENLDGYDQSKYGNDYDYVLQNVEIDRPWVEADPTGDQGLDQTLVDIFYSGEFSHEPADPDVGYMEEEHSFDITDIAVVEVERGTKINDNLSPNHWREINDLINQEKSPTEYSELERANSEISQYESDIDPIGQYRESNVNTHNMVAESRYGKKMLSESQIIKQQDSKTLERIRKLAGLQ